MSLWIRSEQIRDWEVKTQDIKNWTILLEDLSQEVLDAMWWWTWWVIIPWYSEILDATSVTDNSFFLEASILQYRDSSEVSAYFEYRQVWNTSWLEFWRTIETTEISKTAQIEWLIAETDYEYRFVLEDTAQHQYKSYTITKTVTTLAWSWNWQDVTDDLFHWFKFDELVSNRLVDEMWNRNMSIANWAKIKNWNWGKVFFCDWKNDFAWLYSFIWRHHTAFWVVKFSKDTEDNCVFDYSNNSWLFINKNDIWLLNNWVEVFRQSHWYNIKSYLHYTFTVDQVSYNNLSLNVYVGNDLIFNNTNYNWWYNYNRRVWKHESTYTKLSYDTFRLYKRPLTPEEISILVNNF